MEMSNTIIEQRQKNRTFNSTWLKTFKGFEDYSEKEAEKILEQLRELTNIVCRHVQKGNI
jgi:heme-binding NEAT domain protein